MVSTAMKATADVSITSDLMCPWCWVGLKKLQEAGHQANIEPKITWKPFLLRPDMPKEGTPKGGTPSSRVGARMKQAGESVGINFTGRTDRSPNTKLFHATMHYLQEQGLDHQTVTAFQEAVFLGYFTLGIYPDQKGLLEAAKKVENDKVYNAVSRLFEDPDKLMQAEDRATREALNSSRRGISGVPSFSFGNQADPAFSGAQPTEVFVRYLQKYAKEVPSMTN